VRFGIDRKPQYGQKVPVAYRVWTVTGDTHYEAFADDRDVVLLGYGRAIEIAKDSIRALTEGEPKRSHGATDERALAEIEQLGNERNLIIIPPPPEPPRAPRSVLSDEQNEAMQGAISLLRMEAGLVVSGPNKGQTGNVSRRYKEWADVLEEYWEDLR